MKNFTHTKKILMATAVLLSFSVSSQVSKNKPAVKNQAGRQSSSTNIVTEVLPTPFWSEDFGTAVKDGDQGTFARDYKSSNGLWELTDVTPAGPKANMWFVSAMEVGMGAGSCSGLFSEDNTRTNNTLHIGKKVSDVDVKKNDMAATYWKNESSYTDSRIESPSIDCSGQSNITFNFEYFCGGIAGTDFLSLYYFDGSSWSLITTFGPSPSSAECSAGSKALWKISDSYFLPASANNNPNVKIGFRWTNQASVAGNSEGFSVAIDNVVLSSTSSSGGGSSIPAARLAKINSVKKAKSQSSNLRAVGNNNQAVLNNQLFWTEDFGTAVKNGDQGTFARDYKSSNGLWELNDMSPAGPKANTWFISAMEVGMGSGNCSRLFTEDDTQTNNTLHIGKKLSDVDNTKNDFSAKYWKNESSFTDSRIESPTIDCSGKSNVLLNFDYFCGGIAGTDYLSLYYYDGSNWSLMTTYGPSENTQACNNDSKSFWRTSDSYQLPSSADNNPSIRIGFRWTNNSAIAGNTEGTSVAIDNVILSATESTLPLSSKTVNKNNTQVVNSDLITIKAVVEKVEPVIYFTTTTEVYPTRDLVIENSIDGKNFTKLTDVKSIAQGTVSAKLSYTYTDVKAKEGVNYYRVKQTNVNGKSVYSKVASVELKNSGEKKASGINPTEVVNNNKIDVIDVRAVIEKNEPSIYFTTYSEKYPAKDIIIEGSKDGINYSPISKIKSNAKKDVVGKLSYTYTDANAHEGVNYYRIIQTNADGTVITSKVVSVDFIKVNDKKVTFTVYPNPNSGQFTIDFSGIENNHEVQLVLSDMTDGREIYTTSFYSNSVESNKVDVNPPTKIPTGRYACSLIFEGIKNTVIIMIE